MAVSSDILSYHEPELPQLLVLLSFLYLLFLAGKLADRLLYAGLLGQIALGTILGAPLGGVLERIWEETWLGMGYVGLIGVVFQGGLEIDPRTLGRTLHLALVGAVSGVLLPISFSFALLKAAFGYETIHSFVVGCALSSTSLGTTLFVLQAQPVDDHHESGTIAKSEFGSVLMGAALIDDVIALVLLSVVKSLPTGSGAETVDLGWVIGRPVVASLGMAVVSPCLTFFAVQPLHQRYAHRLIARYLGRGGPVVERKNIQGVMFFLALSVLSAHLTVSYYIETTPLLGSFLAGVMLSSIPVRWHDKEETQMIDHLLVLRTYAGPVQDFVFSPLFFASIGYTIPFLSLFRPLLVWRGVLYSVFMCLGKVLVGPIVYLGFEPLSSVTSRLWESFISWLRTLVAGHPGTNRREGAEAPAPELVKAHEASSRRDTLCLDSYPSSKAPSSVKQRATLGLALGTALVARGEIGILILQVAYSKSQTASTQGTLLSEDVYLIGIWAVALCTIAGPIAFAVLMRSNRVRATISRNSSG